MQIFISYRRAEDDKSYLVGTIHEKLAKVFGEKDVFRDIYNISAGADWKVVLGREINSCKVMLVIIGPDWANLKYPNGKKRLLDRNDVTRWEIETGLERSKGESVTVIPVLVLGASIPNKGELPKSLHPLLNKHVSKIRNFPDFDADMEKLIQNIRSSLGFMENGITIAPFEPKTIYVTEGSFLMGSDPGVGISTYETPRRKVTLPAYRIGQYPVTNIQFAEFIRQNNRTLISSMRWHGQKIPEGLEHNPVTDVTWYEVRAYCQWLREVTKRNYSIPNEAQWEKACRGGNDYFYPWGNEFDPARCNHGRSRIASVYKYPPQNDFGCFDFVGNIRQWTCTLWGDQRPMPSSKYLYPWEDDGRNDLNASREIYRVVRGSTMDQDVRSHRCSARRAEAPELRGAIGFRVVINL